MKLYIKELMRSRSVTSVELAERIGVSKTMVSYWLSGKNFPSPDNLDAIAAALGVPLWRLFAGTGDVWQCENDVLVGYISHGGNDYILKSIGDVEAFLASFRAARGVTD